MKIHVLRLRKSYGLLLTGALLILPGAHRLLFPNWPHLDILYALAILSVYFWGGYRWMTAVTITALVFMIPDRFFSPNIFQESLSTLARRMSGATELIVFGLVAALLRFNRIRFLRDSEEQRLNAERLEALLDSAPDAILLVNHDGTIRVANRSALELFGYAEGELDGQAVEILVSERVRPQYRMLQETYFQQPEPKDRKLEDDLIGITKDGREVPLEVRLRPLRLDGELKIHVAIRDMSGQRRAEKRADMGDSRILALRRIDMAITGSLDLRLTLDVILIEVRAQLKIDAASILLMHGGSMTLEYMHGSGFRTDALKRSHLELGEGFAGQSAVSREKLFVEDIRSASGGFPPSGKLSREGFISYLAVPLIAKGRVQAIMEIFHRERLVPDKNWYEAVDTLAAQAAIGIDNARLFESLDRSHTELVRAYDKTLEGWAHALDIRDEETEGHTRRVTNLMGRFARQMGIGPDELVHIRRGALLHDIGKLGIPDSILLKPGKLTDDEFTTMKKHTQYAFEWLSPIAFLKPALDIPYAHHEKWDGTGYPRGLKGEAIPLAARMFALVDVYDALLSDRPYRAAWTKEATLDHIKKGSGTHFDPALTEEFLKLEP